MISNARVKTLRAGCAQPSDESIIESVGSDIDSVYSGVHRWKPTSCGGGINPEPPRKKKEARMITLL